MNILDIAIAKKLAGGGGGSGTNNYNDLSNLPKINDTTLSGNKSSSALGLQSEINSDSKLASDLVDDTNQDNKFVTSTEKNTWNAKQNAIDSDHKLSSDLVDDANKTNKFVTSTEKNTWNAKQNAIDSDHKLSSSLVSFSTAEAAALASGIDSTKVGQISANQTNILYGIKTGAKNQLKLTGTVYNPNKLIVIWDYENGTVRVTGSTPTTDTVFINLGTWTAPEDDTYRIYANSEACTANIRVYDNGTWGTYTAEYSNEATWTKGTTRTLYLRIAKNVVVGDITVTPMICPKSIFDADPTFAPYALPNYDLTRLESEDRAALAEEIDAGAKSLVPMTWTNADPFADIHMTKNSDGSITVTATNTVATRIVSLSTNINNYLTVGKRYVLSGCDGGDYSNHYGFALSTSDYTGRVFEANGSEEFTYASEVVNFTLVVRAGESWTKTFKPMICTKAAFGVSNKFVPYAKSNYSLTQDKLDKCSPTIVPSGDLNDITTNQFAIYSSNVSSLPVSLYCFVRTSVATNNERMQEATVLSDGRTFVRSYNGSWHGWRETTTNQITNWRSDVTFSAANTYQKITSVSVPAGVYMRIDVGQFYSNGIPTGIIISKAADVASIAAGNTYGKAEQAGTGTDYQMASFSTSAYFFNTQAAFTMNIFCRCANASKNTVFVTTEILN